MVAETVTDVSTVTMALQGNKRVTAYDRVVGT